MKEVKAALTQSTKLTVKLAVKQRTRRPIGPGARIRSKQHTVESAPGAMPAKILSHLEAPVE